MKVGAKRIVCSRLNFVQNLSPLLEMATVRVFAPVIIKRWLIKLECDVVRGNELDAIWVRGAVPCSGSKLLTKS